MVQADALSRRADLMIGPDNSPEILLPADKFIETMNVTITDQGLEHCLRSIGAKDDLMMDAVAAIQNGKIPPLQSTLSDWHLHNGILWYKGRVYIPNDLDLRRDIVRCHHDLESAGHPGQYGTYLSVFRTYWWPRISTFIKNYVDGCALCQQNKINTHPTVPPLMPIKADQDALPFSTISMDFIMDLPESNGYTALYVVVDHNLSKGIILIPCTKEETSMTTAQLYHDHVYRRYGILRAMISDRGPQFASQVFQELCERLGIRSRLSTAYHPQTDGQTERMNREVEAYL